MKNLIDACVSFRSIVKGIGVNAESPTKQKLLAECDNLRDKILPELFIRVQVNVFGINNLMCMKDQDDGTASWTLIDQEMRERELRAAKEASQLLSIILIYSA